MNSKKIFVDPGHGGEDNGAVWGDKLGYIEEDDINLSIAHYLRYNLLLNKYQVMMSRETDIFVDLAKRVDMANMWAADLFVSIHCDAFHNTTAEGMTVHVHPDSPNMLAHYLVSALNIAFPNHKSRGVHESNFFVLRETDMKAVLVECEFISNPKTRRFLKEPENQIKLAEAITNGINKYYSK